RVRARLPLGHPRPGRRAGPRPGVDRGDAGAGRPRRRDGGGCPTGARRPRFPPAGRGLPAPALLLHRPGRLGLGARCARAAAAAPPTRRAAPAPVAAGGGHTAVTRTAESVADEIERWLDAGAADGFSLTPPTRPGRITDCVDQVVPLLQRRGRFRREYEGT